MRASLRQLFGAARTAAGAGELETARAAVDTAESVCRNKLPPGDRRERLLHGCAAAARALGEAGSQAAGATGPEPAVAAEYLERMRERLA